MPFLPNNWNIPVIVLVLLYLLNGEAAVSFGKKPQREMGDSLFFKLISFAVQFYALVNQGFFFSPFLCRKLFLVWDFILALCGIMT
jgi:hypothetical protein